MFQDHLVNSETQRTKEIIVSRGKFRVVENSVQGHFSLSDVLCVHGCDQRY